MPAETHLSAVEAVVELRSHDAEVLLDLAQSWLAPAADLIAFADAEENLAFRARMVREGARQAIALSHIFEAIAAGRLDLRCPGVADWLRAEREVVLVHLRSDRLAMRAMGFGKRTHLLGFGRGASMAEMRRLIDEDLDRLAVLDWLLRHDPRETSTASLGSPKHHRR